MGVAGGLASHAARGADPLAECVQLADDASRLSCYDRVAGRGNAERLQAVVDGSAAVSASTATPATAAAAAKPPVAAASDAKGSVSATDPVADFGLSQRVLKERAPADWVDSVPATVESVGQSASGRYVVTLKNGQVWTQTETNSFPVLRPGDPVTIKRAAVGSFVLNGPRSISWRVRRVR